MKQIFFLLALALLGSTLFSASAATEVESGRHIYFQGQSLDGQAFTANVGAAFIAVPATALPCAGCHGRDGEGRPEGGVKPSNITWDNLTRSYGGTSKSGRSFKTYDEKSFLLAVTEGRDSNGNKLDNSMPRFNISKQDARDLVAYLKVIQNDYDPGISDDEIMVGTLLPNTPGQKALKDAVTSVIRARMQEINEQGGIYGRKLSLKVEDYQDQQSFIGQANNLITDDQIFALLSPFSSRADQALTNMVEEAEIPSIAPFTQFPTAEGGRHQYTFYLYGGLDMQVSVLIKRISDQSKGKSRVAVLRNVNGPYSESADRAIMRLNSSSIDAVSLTYDLGKVDSLIDILKQAKQPTEILFVGPVDEFNQLVQRSPDKNKGSLVDYNVHLPGFFVTSQVLRLPKNILDRLNMAYLTVPGSREKPLNEFKQFMLRNKLDFRYLNVRLFAYSAMKTLEEGIKRSGKRLTRKKLVSAIEGLYEFDAGLNQPISFGSRRRTGLRGAFIVSMNEDLKGLSEGVWVKITD